MMAAIFILILTVIGFLFLVKFLFWVGALALALLLSVLVYFFAARVVGGGTG